MHHPECQNEIDAGRKSDALPSAQMEFKVILHAGLPNSSLDLGEHHRLNIRCNHAA